MFGLTRWEPAGISRLHQEMESLFDRFFGREDEWIPSRVMRSLGGFHRDLDELFGNFFGDEWRALAAGNGGPWPRFESLMDGNDYVIRAELPGVSPEHLEVSATRDTLTIRGERKAGSEDQGQVSHLRFFRSFTLPEGVDAEKVKARLANGILEIRMPAPPSLLGKRIPVEVGAGEAHATKELKAA